MALFVRKGGSRHAGQAALTQRNIHSPPTKIYVMIFCNLPQQKFICYNAPLLTPIQIYRIIPMRKRQAFPRLPVLLHSFGLVHSCITDICIYVYQIVF